MKITTWNINGIRASKVPLKTLLEDLDADIICLQETKVTRDQLDEPTCTVEGFNSYFSFSRTRSGYSGVATFVKDSATPVRAEEGLSGVLCDVTKPDTVGCHGNYTNFDDEELHSLDKEGRTVITQHDTIHSNGNTGTVAIINVYCPRADPEREERAAYKLRFYELLQLRAEALVQSGSSVIVLGDVNTSHRKIDHCDPANDEEFNSNPGRKWLNDFLSQPYIDDPEETADVQQQTSPSKCLDTSSGGGKMFIDTFRYLYPTKEGAYTCWSTVSGARATNYGTRIDYIFGDVSLSINECTECEVQQHVMGSDHCPVRAKFSLTIVPAARCPSYCTKNLPEFTGKQQKLSSFFKKCDKNIDDLSNSSLSSSQESNESQVTFKRKDSGAKDWPKSKKLKSNISKQGSLKSFFVKKESINDKDKFLQTISDPLDYTTTINKTNGDSADDKNITRATNIQLPEGDTSTVNKHENINNETLCELKAVKSNTVAAWKTMFKGPAKPPMCSGHSEPCVLRTVKKDTLNKGRQFWICPRPEGHKNNKEARCGYFVWIDKKSK